MTTKLIKEMSQGFADGKKWWSALQDLVTDLESVEALANELRTNVSAHQHGAGVAHTHAATTVNLFLQQTGADIKGSANTDSENAD